MSPHFDSIGIVVSDMTASVAFYRLLGLMFPEGAEGDGHVEADLPGGTRLMLDTEDVVRSFDATLEPPPGAGRIGGQPGRGGRADCRRGRDRPAAPPALHGTADAQCRGARGRADLRQVFRARPGVDPVVGGSRDYRAAAPGTVLSAPDLAGGVGRPKASSRPVAGRSGRPGRRRPGRSTPVWPTGARNR